MKKLLITLFVLITAVALFIIIKPNLYNKNPHDGKSKVDYIKTDNYANKKIKFYYYIPQSLLHSEKPFNAIIWVPALSCDGQETLPHEFYDFADKNGFAILTPSFNLDERNRKSRTSYGFPEAWSGEAFMRMLEKAKANGFNYSKLYMAGLSAGGQFASRFSLLKPDIIEACAILSSNDRVTPTEKVKNIKYFYGIGTKDEQFRIDNAEYFTKEAQKLGIDVEYKKYDIGHEFIGEEVKDIVNFFERVKNNQS